MDIVQAIGIAILQGATELFPVSSLGHAVVVPALLNSSVDQSAPEFLPFLVMLHVGTAVALLAFFWRDWLDLIRGVLGVDDAAKVAESRRLLLLIIVATIPAGVVGGVLEHKLRQLFDSPAIVSGFLIANGVLLIVCERLRGRSGSHRPLTSLTMRDATVVGVWQCLALIPGLSRSGATIVGGLLRGFDHGAAAHFSFLIATPIILGATALEVPKLLHASVPPGTLSTAGIAAVVAGLTALASTWILMRLFRRHDSWSLTPFGIYCLAFGALGLVVLGTH
jgi:undecaprenyl-diphosphatase